VGRALLFCGKRLRRFKFGENDLGPFVKAATGIGQALATRCAIEKPNTEMILQGPDMLADHRSRHAERICYGGERTEFRRPNKDAPCSQDDPAFETPGSDCKVLIAIYFLCRADPFSLAAAGF